jgi:hypothetical protein
MRGVPGTAKYVMKPCHKCGKEMRAERAGTLRERKFCSRHCSAARPLHHRHRANLKRFPAIEHPTMMDIGWAAGLYEGEGSVAKRQNAPALMVTIPQVDRWILDRMARLFGGSVFFHSYAEKREGPSKGTIRKFYRWFVNGPRAMAFMLTIYSFLSPRRKMQFQMAYLPTVSM